MASYKPKHEAELGV